MALTVLPGGLFYPMIALANPPAFSTDTTLDAAADRSSTIFTITTAGSIDKVLFRVGALTTGVTLDVRLETVSATTGAPSTTLWATNTSGQQTSPAANTTYEVTLTAAATVALGDLIALVIQPSTTPVNLGITRIDNANFGFTGAMPYGMANTTGSYAFTIPIVSALHYSGGSWVFQGPNPLVIDTFTTFAFNTSTGASTGTARGLRFTLPMAARLAGAWVRGNPAGDYQIVLYTDAGSTLLTSQTFDKDQVSGAGGRFLPFTSTYDLVAATTYRLAVVPTAAVSFTSQVFTVTSADHLDAHQGGQNFHECAFISSAWVNNTTQRPWMGLWLTHLDDGAAAGGYLLVSN